MNAIYSQAGKAEGEVGLLGHESAQARTTAPLPPLRHENMIPGGLWPGHASLYRAKLALAATRLSPGRPDEEPGHRKRPCLGVCGLVQAFDARAAVFRNPFSAPMDDRRMCRDTGERRARDQQEDGGQTHRLRASCLEARKSSPRSLSPPWQSALYELRANSIPNWFSADLDTVSQPTHSVTTAGGLGLVGL